MRTLGALLLAGIGGAQPRQTQQPALDTLAAFVRAGRASNPRGIAIVGPIAGFTRIDSATRVAFATTLGLRSTNDSTIKTLPRCRETASFTAVPRFAPGRAYTSGDSVFVTFRYACRAGIGADRYVSFLAITVSYDRDEPYRFDANWPDRGHSVVRRSVDPPKRTGPSPTAARPPRRHTAPSVWLVALLILAGVVIRQASRDDVSWGRVGARFMGPSVDPPRRPFVHYGLTALLAAVLTVVWMFAVAERHGEFGGMIFLGSFLFTGVAVVLSFVHNAILLRLPSRGPLPSMALAALLSIIPMWQMRERLASGLPARPDPALELFAYALVYGLIVGVATLWRSRLRQAHGES